MILDSPWLPLELSLWLVLVMYLRPGPVLVWFGPDGLPIILPLLSPFFFLCLFIVQQYRFSSHRSSMASSSTAPADKPICLSFYHEERACFAVEIYHLQASSLVYKVIDLIMHSPERNYDIPTQCSRHQRPRVGTGLDRARPKLELSLWNQCIEFLLHSEVNHIPGIVIYKHHHVQRIIERPRTHLPTKICMNQEKGLQSSMWCIITFKKAIVCRTNKGACKM